MTSITELAMREPPPGLPAPRERARLRKMFQITQKELAAAMHVSRQTIANWEKGIKEPAGERRDQYAEFLRTLQERAQAQKGKRA